VILSYTKEGMNYGRFACRDLPLRGMVNEIYGRISRLSENHGGEKPAICAVHDYRDQKKHSKRFRLQKG